MIIPPLSVRQDMVRTGRTMLRAEVEYCVSPGGAIAAIKLVKSSRYRDYDEALLAEVGRWRFEPLPKDAPQPFCKSATFVFRHH